MLLLAKNVASFLQTASKPLRVSAKMMAIGLLLLRFLTT